MHKPPHLSTQALLTEYKNNHKKYSQLMSKQKVIQLNMKRMHHLPPLLSNDVSNSALNQTQPLTQLQSEKTLSIKSSPKAAQRTEAIPEVNDSPRRASENSSSQKQPLTKIQSEKSKPIKSPPKAKRTKNIPEDKGTPRPKSKDSSSSSSSSSKSSKSSKS